jgi:hypothetical protein
MMQRVLVMLLFGAFFYSPACAAPSADTPVSPSLSATESENETGFDPSQNPDVVKAANKALDEAEKNLPGGFIKMSGRYRLAAGVDSEDVILNDANADLQERNFRYLFGERLNNTYDRAIYSQLLINLNFKPKDKFNFYTEIVNDPWSWVGTTGEKLQRSDIGGEEIRYNLKYFGALNSVINEAYRTNVSDSVAFPVIKIKDGRTTQTVVRGFFDFNPATNGIPFTIPEHELDYEYRPIRKLWMDYKEEDWHLRLFALADERQALSTDDPLELSNHKDYWQQSPWLYQYIPIQFFSDGSVRRGYYSDSLSFLARDSEGNRLVLLRGASLEAARDKTYFAGTVAAPYTPWDEHFFRADNVPGAFRIKHQTTDALMVGSVYTFRSGLVDSSVADFHQVLGADVKYNINQYTDFKAEVAGSHREQDLLTNEAIKSSDGGYAYKAAVDSSFEHKMDGQTDLHLSYTQMDQKFDANLSRYSNTRDDHFWGNHLTFEEYSPDLEHFRIGDGIDRNRMVIRARWKEKLFKERFQNLIDVRNVHKTNNTAYLETVFRDEVSYRFTNRLTGKALFRWHGFPETTGYVDPYIASFYFIGFEDTASLRLQNVDVPADVDADRFTYSAALQYVINSQWTAEGFYERTNDVPDFPRGLLNNAFRDANDRLEGLLVDHVTTFLYGQRALGGVPPYDYFNIFRERIIFKPEKDLKFTLHMAQNGYEPAAGIDDNVNHEGLSVQYDYSEKLSFFFDYTHSRILDLPKLIANNFSVFDVRDHHNFYGSFDYKINSKTVFRSEYGVFGLGTNTPQVTPYSVTSFSLPTIDTEHLFRVSLTGEF